MQLANCWKQTNKQTIDSNAISKIFNRKRLTGQSFSKMKKAAGIVKTEYFSRIYHVLDTWHSFFQLCVGWCNHFLAGCGWVWHFLTFILLDVGMCDLFFGWVWVGVGGYDLFWLGVGECEWVWLFFGWV